MKKTRVVSIVCAFAIFASVNARASFTHTFDSLLTELQYRSLVLSNSTDKVEQKQKIACDKSIKAILKPAKSLASDFKTGAKVAKTLTKAFTNEFAVVTLVSVNFTNNLNNLLIIAFTDLGDEVQSIFEEVQGLVSTLPDGDAKMKAQAALDAAQTQLSQLPNSSSFSDAAKLLSLALRNELKSEGIAHKVIDNNPIPSGMNATFNFNTGDSLEWTCPAATAEWVQTTGVLDIGGVVKRWSVNVTLCSGFNGAIGDYALSSGCGGIGDSGMQTSYSVISGTLHVSTIDTVSHSLGGTFSYTLSNGTNIITITNGTFKLENLLVSP